MKKVIVSSFVILLLIQCKAPNNNSTPIEFIINQFDVPNNRMEIKFRITNPTQEVWEGGQWSLHWNQFIGSIKPETLPKGIDLEPTKNNQYLFCFRR